jgi:hypothetical protein
MFLRTLTLCFFLVTIAACGGGSSSPEIAPATLTGITITAPATQAIEGTNVSLTVTGRFDNNTSTTLNNVAFSTSNADLAAVTSTGIVNFLQDGSVTISASIQGFSDTISFAIVDPSASSIAFGSNETIIAKGNTLNPPVIIDLNNNSQTQDITGVTFTSSASDIATVSDTGKVTAVMEGTATVTAKLGDLSATTTVTVTPAVLTAINIQVGNASVPLGINSTISAIGTFSDGSTSSILPEFTVNETSVATVETTGGVFTVSSQAPGSTSISAFLDGITSNAVNFVVTDAQLESISISTAKVSIPEGTTLSVTVIGNFTDNTTQTVTSPELSIDNTATASFSLNDAGTITLRGNAIGTFTLTATNENQSITQSFTVTDAIINFVNFDAAEIRQPVGQSQTVQLIATFSNNTTAPVTESVMFSVSDINIATVVGVANGSATLEGYEVGETTLTAEHSGLSAQIPVTIIEAVVVGISSDNRDVSIPAGMSLELRITASLSDGTTLNALDEVMWEIQGESDAILSSSNTNIATITSNTEQTVSVVATYIGFTETFTVTFTDAIAVTVDITAPVIYEGDTDVSVSAIATLTNGETQDVSTMGVWQSDNTDVLTVNSDTATVNASTSGDAVLSFSLQNSTISGLINVNVRAPRLIQGYAVVNNDELSISIGEGEFLFRLFFNPRGAGLTTLGLTDGVLGSRSVGATNITDIGDASAFPLVDRSLDLYVGSDTTVSVMRNSFNNFAVIQLHYMRTEGRNGWLYNSVGFSYAILTDGNDDFSSVLFDTNAVLVQCENPNFFGAGGGCTEITLPYSTSFASSVSILPRPNTFRLGDFQLFTLNTPEVIDSLVVDETNNVTNTILSTITNGLNIKPGGGARFIIEIPPTSGAVANPIVRFSFASTPIDVFTFTGTFQSN